METISKSNQTLGLTVLVPSVPTTCEDYNTMAGPRSVNPCLDDAITSTIYRSWNNEFREKLTDRIGSILKQKAYDASIAEGNDEDTAKTEASEYDRRVVKPGQPKKKGAGETEPTYEQDGAYLTRILDLSSAEVTEFQEDADAIAASIPFDPSPTRKQGALPKLIKELVDKAFVRYGRTGEKIDKVVAGLEAKNPGNSVVRDLDGQVDADSFGRLLKVNQDRLILESQAALLVDGEDAE